MIFFLISLSTFYVYFILKVVKSINILSSEKYDIKNYFKKIKKEYTKTFDLLELTFLFLILIAIVTNEKTIAMCTVVLYMILCLKALKNNQKFKFNINNVRTFIITTLLFITINIVILMDYKEATTMFLEYNPVIIYYPVLYVVLYFIWIVVGVAGIINNLFNKKSSKKKKRN